MTEFDFEELDKAVSDLMKDSVSVNEAPNTPTAQPGVAAVEPEPTPATPHTNEPLAVKRRGKFMDVMHHPKATINRPLANRDSPKLSPPETAKAELAGDTHENEPTGNGYASDPAPTDEWPDPIDFAEGLRSDEAPGDTSVESENPEDTQSDIGAGEAEGHSDEQDANNEPAYESEADSTQQESLDTVIEPEFLPQGESVDEPEISDESVSDDLNKEPEVAMESPFLPDAKVEKRPLGVFVQEEVTAESSQTANTGETSMEQPKPNPELPRELSSELMDLESGSNLLSPVEESGDTSEVEPSNNEAPEATKQPEIKQQYTTKASSAETVSGPIYDTANYHQPIAAKTSNKHKWLLYVIWVLVLLIIGACAGAVYFYISTR